MICKDVILCLVLFGLGSVSSQEEAPERRLSELERLLGLIDREYDDLADTREQTSRVECGTLIGYTREAGRVPKLSPCPKGLRDDGTSCWSDAHIYGKGCCCTVFGCCKNCKTGYRDDGCTCRKTDVGIKVTLGERWTCVSGEELYGGLCYPKCKPGYSSLGCCLCQPVC